MMSVKQKEAMEITAFIAERKYNILTNDCFFLLWETLISERKITITQTVLKYLYYGNNQLIDSSFNFFELENRFVAILQENNIPYQRISIKDLDSNGISSNEDITDSTVFYAHKWIVIDHISFKTILFALTNIFSKDMLSLYMNLEVVHLDYIKYLFSFNNQLMIDHNKEMESHAHKKHIENNILKRKFNKAKRYLISSPCLVYDSNVFIITTVTMKKELLFKLIGTSNEINIDNIIKSLNSSIMHNDDKFYVLKKYTVHNYYLVIKTIDHLLDSHLITVNKQTMLRINLEDLSSLLEKTIFHFHGINSFYNSNRHRYVDNIFNSANEILNEKNANNEKQDEQPINSIISYETSREPSSSLITTNTKEVEHPSYNYHEDSASQYLANPGPSGKLGNYKKRNIEQITCETISAGGNI